ncbi:MAG: hypothetical protein LUP94_02410 [Candidatus Methanomethylicus sp.]|nr:hypothetical protein [Candidatus Methanomethylicus sp.]
MSPPEGKRVRVLKNEGQKASHQIRSFSIDSKVLTKLGTVAEEKDTSINALVNSLLENYVGYELEAEAHGHISLSLRVFKELLSGLSESDITAIAKKLGPTMGEETIMYNSLPRNFSTYIWLVRSLLCSHAKWAVCKDFKKGNTIMLWHKLGKKWSLFMAEYLKAALPEFFGIRRPPEDMIRVSEDYVAIMIPENFKDLL